MSDGYLLAYFLDEHDQEGEAIRFAVSDDQEPYRWTPLSGGAPILRSDVGERGARDPFLVRLRDGGVVVLATDLRIWPGQDWDRTTREGSRSLLVARSSDLTEWSPFELIEVAPSEAGNTWAPKAFWSEGARSWLVFWASALYEQGSDRRGGQHQRILVAPTEDFRTFGQPRVYLDRGRDVIDATFLESEGRWYRFTVDQRVPGGSPDLGHHPSEEIGAALVDPEYVLLADELG